jgi:hypothetical protein
MTVSKRTVFCVSLGSVWLAATPALAQDGGARTHDGFYLQLGAGLGYLSVSSNQVNASGLTLPASQLLIGGSPIRGLAVGGGFIADYAPAPGASIGEQEADLPSLSQYLAAVGAAADFYLDPAQGLHFQGFVGVGGVETSGGGVVGESDPSGMVLAIGAGYEIWLADEWSIGPLFRFIYAPLSRTNVTYSTLSPALLASLTFH